MGLVIQLLISALAVYLTAWMLPGIMVKSFWSAILVTLVLALLNVFVKPLAQVFSLPLTVLTLGLFLLVIDAGIVMLAGWLMDDFVVNGFWWALLFSLILTAVTQLLHRIF